ncbi:MAG: hypothetical protein HYX83_02250 [Chloroflexi bacterium]|nr:hypothetical protein [Chloroflexota bacterium]
MLKTRRVTGLILVLLTAGFLGSLVFSPAALHAAAHQQVPLSSQRIGCFPPQADPNTPPCAKLAMMCCDRSQKPVYAFSDTTPLIEPAGLESFVPLYSDTGLCMRDSDKPEAVTLPPPKQPPRS